MTKKDRIIEILEQIQEIYPQLDRVMITDFDNPKSIIFTTQDNIDEIAEEYGIEPEYTDAHTGEEVFLDDDDEDKGPLQ